MLPLMQQVNTLVFMNCKEQELKYAILGEISLIGDLPYLVYLPCMIPVFFNQWVFQELLRVSPPSLLLLVTTYNKIAPMLFFN